MSPRKKQNPSPNQEQFQTDEELVQIQKLADMMASEMMFGFEDQSGEAEVEKSTSEAAEPPKVLATPDKILSFRDKVVIGNQEDYQLAAQELFVRSVSNIFNSIYNQISTNPEYKKYTKKASGAGIEFLRVIEEIKDSGKFEDLDSTQIDQLVNLLQEQDNGAEYFPVDVVNRLERVITRVKKLGSIRELIEKARELEKQIANTQNKYEIGRQKGYDSMIALRKYQAELEEIQKQVDLANHATEVNIANNDRLNAELLTLKAEQAQIPVDRRVISRPINTESPRLNIDVKIIEAKTLPIIDEVPTLSKLEQLTLGLANEQANKQPVPKIEVAADKVGLHNAQLKIEKTKIDKIIREFIARINRKKDKQVLKDAYDEVNLMLNKHDYSMSPNLQFLLQTESFDTDSQAALILPKIQNILIEKLPELKTGNGNTESPLENYQTIESISFAPCFNVSSLVIDVLQKNDPNLSSQISRIKGFVQTVNLFYESLKSKAESQGKAIPNLYGSFNSSIIMENSTETLSLLEREEFLKQIYEKGIDFSTNWWKTESGRSQLIVNDRVIDARIDLNSEIANRLYICNEDGNFGLYSFDSSLGHAK